MRKDHRHSPQAEPATPEPSAARTESCTCCSGGREPDPTDDNLRALRRLRDLALGVAEKLAARIMDDDVPAAPETASEAPKPQDSLPAMVLAFQRAERGVRQSILLSTKLHADRLAWETQAEAMAAKVERERRQRRKNKIGRLVKEAIECDAEESGEDSYERLEKLNARIDEDDIESDLGFLADSALVDRLCKDCGVEAPWEDWDGEHWAEEEVRDKPPGSVFAGARQSAAPEAGAEEIEPVEDEPPQPEPLQPKADEKAASAAEPPEPEPASPEPDNPRETMMKARLVMAMRSGAWLMALQMDPMLAEYVRQLLNNSS